MKKIRSVLVLVWLLLPTLACAAEAVAVIGAGNDSCGKWIESRRDPGVHYQYKQWIFGFLSGHN